MKTPALTILVIPLALVCIAFAPLVRAACQEGCLSNSNTVLGEDALLNNTAGRFNIAIGGVALLFNTIGEWNTAIGDDALVHNTTGFYNTGVGGDTLVFNTTGNYNTASGSQALFSSTIGNHNTADGTFALHDNTTGNHNTACGNKALRNNTTGDNNIALGSFAGGKLTSGDNNIGIGNYGVADESNTIRIGMSDIHTTTFVAGISGVPVTDGQVVVVASTGQLGVKASSARFEEAIKPMDKTSEAILNLKPVTFRYKKELDPKGAPQFGLVAEEVAKVDADLVVADDHGKPYTVRYEAVNAMLLNEFLKAHKKIEAQANEIAELKSALREVTARLDARGL